ncbi:unnamed protein product [Dimorphilus gyrociliatus]|uniref:Uncharacterized protein n=1 Tax=Dimorphilus gyrociliatus TaxID=2664684 RepID=A0A7I8VR24_9ANNE|nr:unnamed protein product [Dimorphilus gyrociliatus]
MEQTRQTQSGRYDSSVFKEKPNQISSIFSYPQKEKPKSLCELYFETELDRLQNSSRLRRYIRTMFLRYQRISKSVEDMNFELMELSGRLCLIEALTKIREDSIKELNKVIDDVRLNNFELSVKGETVKSEILKITKEDQLEQQMMKKKFRQREFALMK